MKKLLLLILSLLMILSLLVISCESVPTEKATEDEGDDKVVITESETGEQKTESVIEKDMRNPDEPKYGRNVDRRKGRSSNRCPGGYVTPSTRLRNRSRKK